MAADKPGVVLDVGANGGRESMAAVNAGRKVFAVECHSTAYAVLLEMFRNHSTEVSVLHICGGSAAQLAPLLHRRRLRPAWHHVDVGPHRQPRLPLASAVPRAGSLFSAGL